MSLSSCLNRRISAGSGTHPCSWRHGGNSPMAVRTAGGMADRLAAVCAHSQCRCFTESSWLQNLQQALSTNPEWIKVSCVKNVPFCATRMKPSSSGESYVAGRESSTLTYLRPSNPWRNSHFLPVMWCQALHSLWRSSWTGVSMMWIVPPSPSWKMPSLTYVQHKNSRRVRSTPPGPGFCLRAATVADGAKVTSTSSGLIWRLNWDTVIQME